MHGTMIKLDVCYFIFSLALLLIMSLYTFIADTLGHLDVVTLVPKAIHLTKDFVVFSGGFFILAWPVWMFVSVDFSDREPTDEETRNFVKNTLVTCWVLFVLSKAFTV